ncbi:MAG: sigma-70 family RNA polymerase sigma factor [Planctomycetota bacterium]
MHLHPADQHFRDYRRTGNPTALATVFDLLAQELLLVSAHLARRGGEPEDLLQATFLAAIESADRWDDQRPLLPWLIGIMVNQARHEQRERGRASAGNEAPEPVGGEPDPAEVAATDELRETILHTLEALPQPYRHVMTLRWVHGLTAAQIAHSLGSPLPTVKSQLRRGLAILRQALPVGLAASLAALLTPGAALAQVRTRLLECAATRQGAGARPRRAPHAAKPPLGGGAALGAIAVVGALSVGVGLWLTRPPLPPPERGDSVAATPRTETEPQTTDAAPVQRQALDDASTTPAPSTGTLHVSVTFGRDGTPVPFARVQLWPLDVDQAALHDRWLTADADGLVRATDLPPGPYRLRALRGGETHVDFRAGLPRRAAVSVPAGVAVEGLVVDAAGQPVADAGVFVSLPGQLDEITLATRTDAHGAFALRDVEAGRIVSARAPGLATSSPVRLKAETAMPVRFALTERGHTLTGLVRTENGAVVAGARVLLGLCFRKPAAFGGQRGTLPAPPIWLTTDERGRFATRSLFGARTPLWCAAPGFALYAKNLDFVADQHIDIVLRPGARMRGRVVDTAGQAVRGARIDLVPKRYEKSVVAMAMPPWATASALTDNSGRFALAGLQAGSVSAQVRQPGEREGTLTATLELSDGVTTEWSPRLQVTAPLRIELVDGEGRPLPGVRVRLDAPAGRDDQPRVSTTDPFGRVDFEGCVQGPHELILLPSSDRFDGNLGSRRGLQPGRDLVRVSIDRSLTQTGKLRGHVSTPLGPGADLEVVATMDVRGGATTTTGPTGAFELALPFGVYDVKVKDASGTLTTVRTTIDGEVAPLELSVGPMGTATIGLTETARALVSTGSARIVDDAGSVWAHLVLKGIEHRRHRLPVGTYRAVLVDRDAAISATPFTVTADRDTSVVVDAIPGYPVILRLEVPDDASISGDFRSFTWAWYDGDDGLVFRQRRSWARIAADADAHAVRLPAGRYRLELTSDDGLTSDVAFTVTGAAEAASVRVPLRPAAAASSTPDPNR